MNSIIITGADGFIGTHLSQYLTEQGYHVYGIVQAKSSRRGILDSIKNVTVVEGELDDYENIAKSLPLFPKAFFHFAWAGVSPDSRYDFVSQLHNIEIANNAVRLAAIVKAEKFIFPGSTMEYVYYGKPLNKDAIPSPSNAYGVAKIAARYSCSVLCGELEVPFIYVVISGIYSEDRSDNNVIYYTISKLLRGEKPSTTKMEQLWDYVHIDDVVYGLELVARKGKPGAFYAIGHGDNWPLYNYIYQIRDAINPDLPLGIGEIPYRNGQLPCSCVDLKAIFDDTGYVPKVPFDDGIRRVIDEVKKKRY